MSEHKAADLIGTTGQYIRNFTIVDAKDGDHGTVDIRVSDDMGNVFWTELDESVSLD